MTKIAGSLWMADPDIPPEVNPTRRDPDEPEPNIPVRWFIVNLLKDAFRSNVIIIFDQIANGRFRRHQDGRQLEIAER